MTVGFGETERMLKQQVISATQDSINYKKRINKAIEYINDWLEGKNNDDIIIAMNKLGNILKGDSDDAR